MTQIQRPMAGEFAEFYAGYVNQVGEGRDVVEMLRSQLAIVEALRDLPADRAGYRYAAGKWSVREVVSHMADTERVFSYRALRIGRGDTTPLPAFAQNAYVESAQADRRAMTSVGDEMIAVRQATLALLDGLDGEALARRGTASDKPVTARALVYVCAGHVAHHVAILRERYGLTLPA